MLNVLSLTVAPYAPPLHVKLLLGLGGAAVALFPAQTLPPPPAPSRAGRAAQYVHARAQGRSRAQVDKQSYPGIHAHTLLRFANEIEYRRHLPWRERTPPPVVAQPREFGGEGCAKCYPPTQLAPRGHTP